MNFIIVNPSTGITEIQAAREVSHVKQLVTRYLTASVHRGVKQGYSGSTLLQKA